MVDCHYFISTCKGLWLFKNVLKLLQLADYVPKLRLMLVLNLVKKFLKEHVVR